MEWTDEGIVLSARKHGESSVIAQLLTGRRGRHAGLVRGGAGRRIRGVLQPGNQVSASWRARLAEHLGTMTVEPVRARAANLLADLDRLAGLSAACAVAEAVLPERQPHRGAYEGMLALLDEIERGETWPLVYVRWEAGLLAELGFGLDLASCARTGAETGLAYVSPRSGRAVGAAAAGEYRDRLLPLPAFLVEDGRGAGRALPATPGNLRAAAADGLALTGHFLARHVLDDRSGALPPARVRLVERFSPRSARYSDISTR